MKRENQFCQRNIVSVFLFLSTICKNSDEKNDIAIFKRHEIFFPIYFDALNYKKIYCYISIRRKKDMNAQNCGNNKLHVVVLIYGEKLQMCKLSFLLHRKIFERLVSCTDFVDKKKSKKAIC